MVGIVVSRSIWPHINSTLGREMESLEKEAVNNNCGMDARQREGDWKGLKVEVIYYPEIFRR